MAWSPRYSEDEVRRAVDHSRSVAEALRRLGLRAAGGNFKSFKKLVTHYGISTDHFSPRWSVPLNLRRSLTPLDEILVEESLYSRGHLKRRLYDAGLKQRRCELCDQDEHWRGRTMSLILDHINGVSTDNRLENLQIVCPNCAATLDTHCGRKNRIEREPRQCRHCAAEFVPRYASQRYCSRPCGRRSKGPRTPRLESRKVERPSYEQLMADVSSMSFLAIGRKYGVSDNAVRKWIRWYEAQSERERIDEGGGGGQSPTIRS